MRPLEQIVIEWLIKRLEKHYGANCPDYDEDYLSCQAKKTIEFLNQHIKLL